MRSLFRISDSFLKQRQFRPSILKVSLYSTPAYPTSSGTLYRRLQRCNDQRVSVIPVLDEWVAGGRQVHCDELKRCIVNFRRNRCFKNALEIAEWMIHSMKHFRITAGHVAVQLDLISKVHGLEQAENYFNGIEDRLKDLPIYGALLNCYADAKSLEKAEATMEEIRKFNTYSTVAYNTMLSLYSQTRMNEKIESLVEEMENRGVSFNSVTYNIRLNSYAGSDVKGMERLLMKMEVDPLVRVDFCSYATAAKGYLKAGALEKASFSLKKAEHLIEAPKRKHAFGILMSYYASMGKKEEVYRLLNTLRNSGKLFYGSYVYILTSLEKLDDLDSAKKILEEWVKENASFDIRIPNIVISSYCKRGRVEEAEIIINRLMETGKTANAKTWTHMALGYYKNGRMEKVLEMTKKAILATYPGWKPDLNIVAACLEYLKMKGDQDGAKEMLMLLEKCGSFSIAFKEQIERYLSNGMPRLEAVESAKDVTSGSPMVLEGMGRNENIC